MQNPVSDAQIKGGGLLAASKGGWAKYGMKPGVSTSGQGEQSVVEVQQEEVSFYDWKHEGIKFEKVK
jgi:hypothetical protein